MIEFGLLGRRLGHSYSPQLHRCFGTYDYQLLPMERTEMLDFVASRKYRGLNVTIPYKQDVAFLCDEISPLARRIGSVNTLYFRQDRLCAENTDLPGMREMLRRGGMGVRGQKVAILGSGGTSLTAQALCREDGAKETLVVSRQGPLDYASLCREHRDVELLINTTPVGMHPETGVSPLDLTPFKRLRGVADVIYHPAETLLLGQAKALGIPCVGGLWMLVSQGWHSARLFLQEDLPEALMENAYAALLKLEDVP